MNPKIKKIDSEYEKNAAKITELQERQRELEKQRLELENLDIIGMVRSMGLTPDQLAALIQGARSNEKKEEPAAHKEKSRLCRQKSVPSAPLPVPGHGEAVPFQGGADLALPSLNDAGGEEHAVRGQKVPGPGGQGDDHVRHDVGQHHPVLAGIQPAGQPFVREHVPGVHRQAVRANTVEGGVLKGHVRRLGVDVHPRRPGRPQGQGGDG